MMTSLADRIRACRECPLWEKQEEGALHVPAFVGENYRPGGIGVICEAPGFYEAKSGVPLMGKAGTLFDALAAEAGVPRDTLMLTNTVRCRPPNNRIRDYPEAVANCAHWTAEELAEYQPRVLVLMGATAIKSVFGTEATVSGTRGVFAATPTKHDWGSRVIVSTYHPAAAGYQGGAQSEVGRIIVQDLMLARRALETLGG